MGNWRGAAMAALTVSFIGDAELASADVPGCGGADILARLSAEEPATYQSFMERAHAVPYGAGRFWMVQYGDNAPSYIFGTFHVVEAAELGLTPPVRAKLSEAERLVVEVEPKLAKGPDRSAVLAPVAIADRLGPELTGTFNGILSRRGIDPSSFSHASPLQVLARLEVIECMFEGGPVMDSVLQRWAQANGVPIMGLEAPYAAAESFQQMTDDEVWQLVMEAIRQYDVTTPEDAYQTTLALYLADETQAILDLGRLLSARAGSDPGHARAMSSRFVEYLITRRNLAWLPRLTELAAEGGSFIAVGAGHLPGENGILALLERSGFKVTRLDPGQPAPGGLQALLPK